MKNIDSMKHIMSTLSVLLFLFTVGCAVHENSAQEKTGVKTTLSLENIPGSELGTRQTSNVLGATPASPSKKKIFTDEYGEYRLVKTPFGTFKQPIKKTPILTPTLDQSGNIAQTGQKPSQPTRATTTKPPATIKSEAAPPHTPASQGDLVLNFDNADLVEVIRTMAEMLKINYILDQNVRGKVTIQTSGKLKKADLFSTFFQILEANNLTAVEEDGIYKIMPPKEASRMPVRTQVGREAFDIPPGERIIIQIIPLDFIAAAEMTKLLQPFISTSGTIISHQDSNTLLLVDKGINIIKALKLVEVFDVNVFDNVQHRFFPLANIDTVEGTKILSEILTGYGILGKDGVQLIAIERLNMILAISATPGLLNKITPFIQQVDIPSQSIEPRIYVYSVKNGESGELAGLLNQVFGQSSADKEKSTSKSSTVDAAPKEQDWKLNNPFLPKASKAKKNKKSNSRVANKAEGSGTLRHEIKIIADEIRNALIIEAVPADYQTIKAILTDLDVLPRQVLIEVTIAEIKLDDSFELGMDWSFKEPATPPIAHSTGGNIAVTGLQYFISETNKWNAKLSTLASKNKINILSSPSLLATDNKEAKINISTEVPVASTIYQSTNTNTTAPLLQTNIQYRNTGVILSVTPHINDNGLVSMDINQEVSEQSDPVSVGTEQLPSFFKRSVSTSLTVKHGQTIVIGGLIRESRTKGGSGVPFFRDIPYIGYLFGTESDITNRTEMIILITPRVIASLEDIDLVTQEFQSKLSNFKTDDF